MKMKSNLTKSVFTLVCVSAMGIGAQSALAGYPFTSAGDHFLQPGSWNVGDAGSTNQHWDQMPGKTNNSPDVSHVTNPSGPAAPTLSALSPGFWSGSFSFYSFTGNYGVEGDIYNHTGYGSTYGTHVIVQTSGTVNPDPILGGPASVLYDTMQIVDLSGNALVGGDNTSALQEAQIWSGVVGSAMGDVTLETRIWEFFLPNYTGDFRVKWNEIIHSSFDELRVDTMIAESAFPITAVPEPASATFLLFGSACLLCRRRANV